MIPAVLSIFAERMVNGNNHEIDRILPAFLYSQNGIWIYTMPPTGDEHQGS